MTAEKTVWMMGEDDSCHFGVRSEKHRVIHKRDLCCDGFHPCRPAIQDEKDAIIVELGRKEVPHQTAGEGQMVQTDALLEIQKLIQQAYCGGPDEYNLGCAAIEQVIFALDALGYLKIQEQKAVGNE